MRAKKKQTVLKLIILSLMIHVTIQVSILVCLQNDYDAISVKCRKLAVDLLSSCRTYSETTALLCHNAGIEAAHGFHEASFPRIMVALHYQQKEVNICCIPCILCLYNIFHYMCRQVPEANNILRSRYIPYV